MGIAREHLLIVALISMVMGERTKPLLFTGGLTRHTWLPFAFRWLPEKTPCSMSMDRIGFGLVIEPPGEIHHLGSDTEEIPSPVRINSSALTVVYFEKSAVTWFWRDRRFHQVWTAD
jgi:hypothetical protein